METIQRLKMKKKACLFFKFRKERDELRKELKIRDMIIAFYEHELNETLKDLDILHKVNMSLGAMIAVWVDQKKKG